MRNRLRNKYGGVIAYDRLTYGELTAKICIEGLALCNDHYKKQLEKQKSIGQKEMGDFCEQFGFEPKYKSSSLRKPFKKKKKKIHKRYSKESPKNPQNLTSTKNTLRDACPSSCKVKKRCPKISATKLRRAPTVSPSQ